ncbi:hypothetical protein [Myroides fluvii]|uniref:hypothetical protein n=1 Tax=Myroides fluvii TaxID=2572594 RepID=UPI00131B981A|nr:hypothetical protein [Myroides fluvii]
MKLRNRILNYEHWISSNFEIDEPKIYQRELHKLFSVNIDAYTYYRNWLYTLLLNQDEKETFIEFKNILDEKGGTIEHNQLVKFFIENNSSEIFSQKRLNVFEIFSQLPNSDLSQNICFLYQQYFEIEILFWVLYSFLYLNDKNVIETDLINFKDRKGKLKKGVLIDNLKTKLAPYSLVSKLFNTAYNVKIRNIIGHNNYKIVGDIVISLDDDTIRVSKDEILKAIYSIQSLNNYLLNYFSNKSISNDNLENEGVLGISFSLEDDLPVLSVFQLSCFYFLGDLKWGKKVVFNINKNQVKTIFGINNSMTGVYSSELEQLWFNHLRNEKTLKVYLTPIVPRNEEKDFIDLDIGEFVVMNNDEKIINLEYEINKFTE